MPPTAVAALGRAPSATTLRRITLGALIAQVGIVVTGAAVRLTASGLGCPTWPHCTGASLVPTHDAAHPALNQGIEFGNRLLTTVVLVAGISVVVATRRAVPRNQMLVRLAWLQPLGVLAQILLGGVTVLVHLNPVAVAAHFLLSMGIIAAAVALYVRTAPSATPYGTEPPTPVRREVNLLGRALVPVVSLLLLAGTVVTGSGPHGGDPTSPRFNFSIARVAQLHTDIVWVTIGLTFAIAVALRVTAGPPAARAAARDLLVIELAQGFIGYLQYFTGDPAFVVWIHVLGACFVWVGTLRLVHTLRETTTDQISGETATARKSTVR